MENLDIKDKSKKLAKKINTYTNVICFCLFMVLCYALNLKWNTILLIFGISIIFESLIYIFAKKMCENVD